MTLFLDTVEVAVGIGIGGLITWGALLFAMPPAACILRAWERRWRCD